jgi:16S rRNA C1402 N4-methylase RsmH
VESPSETVALVRKFILLNHHSQNTHGPMTVEKLVTMLLENVAAAVKDGTTWQGGHMSLILSEHGYRT